LMAATVIAAMLAGPAHGFAAPLQLNCTLTDTADQLGAENRPIVVTFDQDAKTLNAQDGGPLPRHKRSIIRQQFQGHGHRNRHHFGLAPAAFAHKPKAFFVARLRNTP